MKNFTLLTVALLSVASLSFAQVDNSHELDNTISSSQTGIDGTVDDFTFDQTVDHSLEFVDKDGNIVADGSVITRDEVEDPFGTGSQISSGLYAKNTTSGVVNFGFTTTIVSMPSGSFSHCYPGNCKNTDSPASNSVDERKVGSVGTLIKAGETASLQSEWYVSEGNYGTTTVTYQFKIYEVDATFDYKLKGDGPKVTVNYVYKDPAGIEGVVADKTAQSQEFFDLNGRKVAKPVEGKVYVSKNKKYIYHK